MTYTRINGTYTQTMPWGEKITAASKEDLATAVMKAHWRENARQEIVRRTAGVR